MEYHISKSIQGSFREAIEKVTAALQAEGFGIITTVDLKEKFKEKLDKDFRNYTILGACNPAIAYKAIQLEDKIGVMLPCNILVQEHPQGQVEVSAVNPLASIGSIENESLSAIGGEVNEKLQAVIDRL